MTPSPVQQPLQQPSGPGVPSVPGVPRCMPRCMYHKQLHPQSNQFIQWTVKVTKKSNERESPLAKLLDDSAEQYIYLQIPKSEMDNPDIKKILPDETKEVEKDTYKDTQKYVQKGNVTKEHSEKTEKTDSGNLDKKDGPSLTPLIPHHQLLMVI